MSLNHRFLLLYLLDLLRSSSNTSFPFYTGIPLCMWVVWVWKTNNFQFNTDVIIWVCTNQELLFNWLKEIGRRERKVGVTPNLLEMMVMMVGIKQEEEWKEFSQMRQCWMESIGMTLLWTQSLWIFDRRPFLSKTFKGLHKKKKRREGQLQRQNNHSTAVIYRTLITFTETYVVAQYRVPYTLDLIKCTQQTSFN